MTRTFWIFGVALVCVATALQSRAALRYVNVNSTNATPPYTNWATAATNIQDAIDVAMAGDEVVVTNGVYEAGGRGIDGVGSNRVAVTTPLVLRSVNGPAVTVIHGHQVRDMTNGDGAIRCVYLTNGATLIGFTLTNGATADLPPFGSGPQIGSGGAVWCESTSTVISNCVISGNSASFGGGGAYKGTLNRCTLKGNVAGFGAGAWDATLNGCVLTGNRASDCGGGAGFSVLNNCAIFQNYAGDGGGAVESTLNNCTVTGNYGGGLGGGLPPGFPQLTVVNNSIIYYNIGGNGVWGSVNYSCMPEVGNGQGNITNAPHLASPSHIGAGSPCRGAGSPSFASGTDIDGQSWGDPPSIGCDEVHTGSETGPVTLGIQASFTNVVPRFSVTLTANIIGNVSASRWEFGDGTVISNQPYTTHAWSLPGTYPLVLRAFNESFPEGVSVTSIVSVAETTYHVDAANTNPSAPYASWASAARTIQSAVDAATFAGATVLVTNGIYDTGGRALADGLANQVAVTMPLILRSVNGPEQTVIRGYRIPGMTNGDSAVRCVHLTNGASLFGFTLTNGATRTTGWPEAYGGGVWCESSVCVVSNCLLIGNSAGFGGGGAAGGTLKNCRLERNLVTGGLFWPGSGGGAASSTLENCTLTLNSADSAGGGASESRLNNCTVTGNWANNGGGVTWSTLTNCVVYNNTSIYGPDYGPNFSHGWFDHCCTSPMPGEGIGNITNAPLFVDAAAGNFRLQSDSPCINAGRNASASPGPALDGNPRIVGGTVDIGAYEFQLPQSILSYAWLQQYGLPVDGSSDFADPDIDGANNWQEWRTGTDPLDPQSVLRLFNPVRIPGGLMISWRSVTNRTYSLERSTNLPSFEIIGTNLTSALNAATFADTNTPFFGPFFYRVRVEE